MSKTLTSQAFSTLVCSTPTRAASGSRVTAWYSFPEFKLEAYIRILPLIFSYMNTGSRYRGIDAPVLVLANVHVTAESWLNKGYFTKFREFCESLSDMSGRLLVVEDIMNPVVLRSLRSHGYVDVPSPVVYDAGVACYPTLVRSIK